MGTLQDKQNAGGRLTRLLSRQHPGDKNALDAWAATFELPADLPPIDRQHKVAELLSTSLGEMRGAVSAVRMQGVPPELVDPYAKKVENAFALSNMHGHWSQAGGSLTPDTHLALRWFAYVLPEDATVISPDDLTDLRQLLAELEARLAEPGLPHDLVQLVQKHVNSIRAALLAYPVQGSSSIRRASRAILTDIHLDEDEIRRAAEAGDRDKVSAVGEAFRKVWAKSASIAGDMDKFGKGGKALSDASEFIGNLLLSAPS